MAETSKNRPTMLQLSKKGCFFVDKFSFTKNRDGDWFIGGSFIGEPDFANPGDERLNYIFNHVQLLRTISDGGSELELEFGDKKTGERSSVKLYLNSFSMDKKE